MKHWKQLTALLLAAALLTGTLPTAAAEQAVQEQDAAAESSGEEVLSAGEQTASAAASIRAPLTDVANAEQATVMVYMIGSNLESQGGYASADLEEMMAAELGEQVNVVVQTMGCTRWSNDAIRSDTAERFTIENGALVLQDDTLGQLDSTAPQTLTDFIRYCTENYPAGRNILLLWDHGGGPVYGYGQDENQGSEASLTLDEIRSALENAGAVFDFIGMDACLMGCLETCCALYPYADYLVASEDFEPSNGWDYQGWLTALGKNVNLSTEELGEIITADFVAESDAVKGDGILSMIDLGCTELLSAAWTEFAYANDSALTSANYSWKMTPTARSSRQDDYYITDILAVSAMVNPEGASSLASVLSAAVVACGATAGDSSMTGLSVTLPYGDSAFYQKAAEVYLNCGFSETYLEWLGTFADCLQSDTYYDNWDAWTAEWNSWEDYHSKVSDGSLGELLTEAATDSMLASGDEEDEDTDDSAWVRSAGGGVSYSILGSGDVLYQDPETHLCYCHVFADDSWWVWHMRELCWKRCEDPGFRLPE